jgi:uncharacterized protein YyaL (SSP411 family)
MHRSQITLNELPTFAAPPSTKRQPDITTALPWRTWDDALREAAQRRLPVMACADAEWSTSAQRLAYVIGNDARLAGVVRDRVVPALIDPVRQPDLSAILQRAAKAIIGSGGPPLIVLATHEGHPFLAYASLQYEGAADTPSLASVIEAAAEVYASNPEQVLAEARQVMDAIEGDGQELDVRRLDVDRVHGGLNEEPKHLHPDLLWEVLGADGEGRLEDNDLLDWVHLTLTTAALGGIYDHLDAGFHRCSRDERWIVPHFEKPVLLNAQMAAVYARAAVRFGNDAFARLARELIGFCERALRDGVDVIAADASYYTWTAQEVLGAVEPASVQVVSEHFGIIPGPHRGVLFTAVEEDDLELSGQGGLERARERLEQGKRQLRQARQKRPFPEVVSLPASGLREQTVMWLREASLWEQHVDMDVLQSVSAEACGDS